ncbi:FGGY carbohydrate kinase domain-containing protein-like [Neofelis nebulosa]|uniref:FGGY carbohydrate kinase domain-containing protein-like n=1 Tax=Neofelis nebulosa TaxID=61452 RepID=UPI00272B4BD6|nr:FGGY carbohydrate kinase domain-containing protein-like [Neofelis nebulosa]
MTGMPVVLSQEVESVLVGAVILGAGASGDFTSVPEAMARMRKVGKVVFPRLEDKRYYDKKYEVFLKLVEHRKEHAANRARRLNRSCRGQRQKVRGHSIRDLCLLILYSRPFRYHSITSVSSFNKDNRDVCKR